MRLALVLAFVTLFVSAPASSQPRPGRMPINVRISSIEQLQASSELLARRLDLDGFVSTRLAAAAGDLEDFQTNAAIAKARGRILEAENRVSQSRQADPRSADVRIGQILREARDILDRAERSSGAMGLADVRKEILRQSGRLQRVLYDDLDEAQKVRKEIGALQKSLNLMAEGLDTALEQALSAMFSYLRSGGE